MNTEVYNLIEGKYWSPKNDSHISRWQSESGRLNHDLWTQEQIWPYIKNCKSILDGGAYNADHTIFYSQVVGSEGTVLAVEAGSVAFTALEHNVKQFPNYNVETINRALWSSDGIKLSHNPCANLGASAVSTTGQMDVETITIDTLARIYSQKFDYIKLDIEGAELFALEGAKEVLERDRPILLIEINAGCLQSFGKNRLQIFSLLEAFKYTYRTIQNCPIHEPQYDLLCLPE